jgi:UDP-N-acetylmuramate dehydrogenase
MNWSNGLNIRVQEDAPLGERTWFRLGGRARWMAQPADVESAATVLRRAGELNIPWKVLGRGANVLVADEGFDGIVMVLDKIEQPKHARPLFHQSLPGVFLDGHKLTVPAYNDLMQLSHVCSQQGLSGLECMAGIPGTVGGAISMNAGGRWGAFGDIVESVELINSDGCVVRRSAHEMGFTYRSSLTRGSIVWSAMLSLTPNDPAATLARFHEIWKAKKSEQPLADRSAGCIFKNPPGQSAGRLIDEAGLKETRRGGAWVSSRHANFILADPAAKAIDIIELIDLVRAGVENRHGILLETEIDIWGRNRRDILTSSIGQFVRQS